MNREVVKKRRLNTARPTPRRKSSAQSGIKQKETPPSQPDQLRKQHAELQAILESIAEALITLDAKGNILSINQAALDLHGFTNKEEFPINREQSAKVFTATYPDGVSPYPPHLWPVTRALRGEKVMDCEIHVARRDTGKSWIGSYNAIPLSDESGKIVQVVVTIHDITKRKLAEKALLAAEQKLSNHAADLEKIIQERTAKLEENIASLDTFCYSIAHDLRAPVRAMQGFTRALLEDHSESLDATGKDFAQRIVASAQRMDLLISDLLEYSRLSRQTFDLEPVNLNAEIEKALHMLSDRVATGKIEVAPLPKVLAHPTVIQQILHNLISNALKFVARGISPQIKIWAETNQTNVRLWIEDNGIGIPSEFREKIFVLFERLNGGCYPGTGVGLAIVRKAVQRMDGAVGVESEPGKGSQFWVEFPAAPKIKDRK